MPAGPPPTTQQVVSKTSSAISGWPPTSKPLKFFDAEWFVTVITPLKATVEEDSLGPPVQESPAMADASKFLTRCCFIGGRSARGDN
jgi:hypothetical protein